MTQPVLNVYESYGDDNLYNSVVYGAIRVYNLFDLTYQHKIVIN